MISEKLLNARELIKQTAIKKEGNNSFSNYDYFTPSQVSELVNTVCQELKLLPLFSLKKDEHGLYGVLKIVDLERKPDDITSIEFQMRTEMPSITATNMTQQMGGCETYTKRYMLMSAFDITDNNLDFDSQDNRKPKAPASKPEPNKIMNELMHCEDLADLGLLWESLTWEEKGKYETIKDNLKEKLTNLNK